MRKLYLSLMKSDETVSWSLLIISFLAGFSIATIFFHFWGHSVNTWIGL